MNPSALIAVLVTKGILSQTEGERLIEFINNKPQSTQLVDAISQIKEFVGEEIPVLKKTITTTKTAITKAKHEVEATANTIASDAVDTAEALAKEIANDALKA